MFALVVLIVWALYLILDTAINGTGVLRRIACGIVKVGLIVFMIFGGFGGLLVLTMALHS